MNQSTSINIKRARISIEPMMMGVFFRALCFKVCFYWCVRFSGLRSCADLIPDFGNALL